jgi:hypothetical protein
MPYDVTQATLTGASAAARAAALAPPAVYEGILFPSSAMISMAARP